MQEIERSTCEDAIGAARPHVAVHFIGRARAARQGVVQGCQVSGYAWGNMRRRGCVLPRRPPVSTSALFVEPPDSLCPLALTVAVSFYSEHRVLCRELGLHPGARSNAGLSH